MEVNMQNLTGNQESSSDTMPWTWTDIKHFHHDHIINKPRQAKQCMEIQVELPFPIFDPVEIADYNQYTELFKPKPNSDSKLKYYKKLHCQGSNKLLKDNVQNHEFVLLPQYVVNVAQGEFEDRDNHAWCYTGGTLDCFDFNDRVYVARAGFREPVLVTDMNHKTNSVILNVDLSSPTYNIKSASFDDDVFVSVRQEHKVSLFSLFGDGDDFKARLTWKLRTLNSLFVDVALNEFRKTEIAAIDAKHKLKVSDFLYNRVTTKYSFPSTFDALSDHFGQSLYFDHNTVAFINRCCIYLLDLRSQTIQNSCLKTSWLKCDDLCTFSQSKQNPHCLYVSSMHSVVKFDARSLKCVDKAMHMLSTPPFISTTTIEDHGEYVCLSGQQNSDKVFLCSSALNSLNLPQLIPNTKDTLTKASLTTRKLNTCEDVEKRLTLPNLGMKLYKDSTGNITLYTLNTAGDVFQQKFVETKPFCGKAIGKLVEWSTALRSKPKVLEATGICNLNNIMHSITARFPEERRFAALMKENSTQKLFEKEFSGLTKHLEGSVGESMNFIWAEGEEAVADNDSEVSPIMASKQKVSRWLHSVL